MITKLTSSNTDKYYAPRFAEITEALHKAGQNYEIKSLEDYFANLTEIAALEAGGAQGGYLLVMPADEEIFTIDANTRVINVPAAVKKNGIGVFGDHRAEMIIMTINRYFDTEDFLQDEIVINWNFTPSNTRTPKYAVPKALKAFAPNGALNPGKVTFGFIITKDMTVGNDVNVPIRGTLTFSVSIFDKSSGEIKYSFNTLPAQVNINDTLLFNEATIIEADQNEYIGRLSNSVYTDDTISPVNDPEWVTGYNVEETKISDDGRPITVTKKSGLDEKAYFSTDQDLRNDYSAGVKLTARAKVDPATADITYKWTYNPLDGTVETVRDYSTVNYAEDYLPIEDLSSITVDDGTIYFEKVLGKPDLMHPMNLSEAQEKVNDDSDTEIVTRGSTYKATGAGIYQVHAQARIGAGKNYEKFIGTADNIKVGTLYYLMDEHNNIDEHNPVSGVNAQELLNAGEDLYVLVSASRNSNEIDSEVLEIPAAKKPTVHLDVASAFEFGDDVILENNDNNYTYIDANTLPTITATISVDSDDNRDSDGVFAVELIDKDADDLTLADIEGNESLSFRKLPANGKFTFQPVSAVEGEYCVRAINRRNGTYSVSDNSEVMKTSFVAPAITRLTVEAMIDDGVTFKVLDNGERLQDGIINVYLDENYRRQFVITDNTLEQDRYNDAITSYYIEEVNSDGTPRTDVDREKDRFNPEEDLREIFKDNTTNKYSFIIDGDPGYYRIKTENRYHGTLRIAYTDIFNVSAN